MTRGPGARAGLVIRYIFGSDYSPPRNKVTRVPSSCYVYFGTSFADIYNRDNYGYLYLYIRTYLYIDTNIMNLLKAKDHNNLILTFNPSCSLRSLPAIFRNRIFSWDINDVACVFRVQAIFMLIWFKSNPPLIRSWVVTNIHKIPSHSYQLMTIFHSNLVNGLVNITTALKHSVCGGRTARLLCSGDSLTRLLKRNTTSPFACTSAQSKPSVGTEIYISHTN